MKLFGAIFVIACALSFSDAKIDKEKAQEMAKHVLTACKEQEGGSDDDVQTMMKFQYPTTPEGNCMLACAHEKVTIVSFYFKRRFGLIKYIIFVSSTKELLCVIILLQWQNWLLTMIQFS